MPRKTVWSEGQDAQIRRMRTEGASWDAISQALGLARWTVIERARALGVHRPPPNARSEQIDADRLPLPAGHSDSWGAINLGTCLQGVAFRPPGAAR
jgi:hypothetical protein